LAQSRIIQKSAKYVVSQRNFGANIRQNSDRFIDTPGKAWRNPSYVLFPGISMKRIRVMHIAAALAAATLTSMAFGQYVWIDERGVRQYSDMPPPASVPGSRILKQPGAATAPTTGSDVASANAISTTEPTAKSPMTTAERNADFQKRKAELAEKERKAAEAQKLAIDKTRNCERGREYQRSLESGGRIARADKNGERSFMTDEQRSRELADTKRALENCK
jgi:hypothetical protein